MEKKNKKELLQIIEEQGDNLIKYKSRLHDIVESYKFLLKEKETLECSIKSLTEAANIISDEHKIKNVNENLNEDQNPSEKKNDLCLQQLKSNLGALTIEKSRIENELRADRKKILQQKEELERRLIEKEGVWIIEKEKYENSILELRKKIGAQQREREKEQHDHVLMLKELQNILAAERAQKEKLEEQVSDLQQKFGNKVSDKKALEYEKAIENLQNKLTVACDQLRTSENERKRNALQLQKLKDETEDIKVQYLLKISEEKERADLTEEKLSLLTFVKEKRIASLENKISELSTVVGEHDKLRQQDQITVQKLKARVAQLQTERSAYGQVPEESKSWEYDDLDVNCLRSDENSRNLHSSIEFPSSLEHTDSNRESSEKFHSNCRAEISRLKEELEQYRSKAEMALKERYSKTSAALLSDAKSGKEIKELRSKTKQLQDQVQTCKSQLKLNEEYHTKITTNLEKSIEDLKVQHKQDTAQLESSHRMQLLELEQQIQKQRERTLLLLEEKDKEIGHLKTSFLSSLVKKDNLERDLIGPNTEHTAVLEPEGSTNFLSNSLISSKKDGHILHYAQELSRKDVEITNLRHSRIQTESALRKMQESLILTEEKYYTEVEALKSRIKLLESSQDEEGTNVEYLKNIMLRFFKCNDSNSKRLMFNAISTVLHFTSSEILDVRGYI